jgi:hypothetical protein
MTEIFILTKSPLKTKKWRVEFDDGKHIDFGSTGNMDFILSRGDEVKRKAYIARHKVREDWSRAGLRTAGFWARWLLWEKPSLLAAIKNIEDRFNLKIIYKK